MRELRQQDDATRQDRKPLPVTAANVLTMLHATAGNGAVATLLSGASAPLAVQRTTGDEVQAWLEKQFPPATGALTKALKPLTVHGPDEIGDIGLDDRLAALSQQLNGHAREIEYGVSKIGLPDRKQAGGVAFGLYTQGKKTYGADVTAPRKASAKTDEKAVQFKVVSTPSPDNVRERIREAAFQLAGKTKSGEVAHPKAQRVVIVRINDAENPYPFYKKASPDFTGRTPDDVVKQFRKRLTNVNFSAWIDKVKLEYSPPRALAPASPKKGKKGKGKIEQRKLTSVALFRPGRVRGAPAEVLDAVNAEHSVK